VTLRGRVVCPRFVSSLSANTPGLGPLEADGLASHHRRNAT
jgi:hypothetical protein